MTILIKSLLRGRMALTLVAALVWVAAAGSTFDTRDLRDTTLRIDYVLTGDARGNITIGYAPLSQLPGWKGRRCNLDSAVVEGAADLTVRDAESGRVLYRQPFCTLFQEWLVSGDTRGPMSMEGTVTAPMPRRPAVATITLRDNRRRPVALASLNIDPDDILIASRPRPDIEASTIYRGQAPDSCRIRVAIIGEGFTADETDRFDDCAARAVGAILGAEPFASYIDNFEFVAVATPSAQSGVSMPRLGVWADTPYGAHFSTFYSDRYLTIPRVWRLYDTAVAAGCDHIIVLANTEEYGGGGILNFYTITAAGHRLFEQVVVHEFGHSFAGLADEYYYDEEDFADETYPLDIEPWERNITTLVAPAGKWAARSGAPTVEGGGYRSHGIWRAADDCRMHSNDTTQFCDACARAIEDVIRFYVD